ncbi:MAG TPA: outer membrane protein assembly factor BamD [Gammaproteobacteria bacterium]|nr:outer membrane protein assembly factor BamD [Gammaproteobacteria bacterium]
MKSVKYLIVIALTFFLSFLLGSCTTTQDPSDAYKGETSQQIFQKGEEAVKDHNYTEAIKRFEALDVQYPFDRNVEIAQLHIIYAYYMSSDYASAEAAADRFIHAHPANPHVDYAYFMRGISNYNQNLGVFERVFTVDLAQRDLSQIKKAYADFADLVRLYPNSYYAPAAHQYMVYLRNILADHELEVAQYYFSREAYVAAANRASLVVRHYEGAPAVSSALVIMARSYRALHLQQNENDVLAVLRYNYPDSTYLKEAMK